MSETMPNPAETAVPAPQPWDPFQLMDRMDEEALRKELDGAAGTDLVYVVKEGGQEVVGLSKTGVDECCMALVSQGQVIREEDLQYELIGEGEDREALFKVKAARYAVSPAGQEVRLDQVIGVKRQPLYYEPAQLDLDARVPSKKYRGRTYRELLASADGRDYLAWMAENFSEPAIRDFVRQILAGEELSVQRERQLNPHWYEAGAMKAARNARFRLIPGNVRAQVIASAREGGQVGGVEAQVQPLLRAVELHEIAEQPEGVPLRDAQQRDLHELHDVLDDVAALYDHDGGHEEEHALAERRPALSRVRDRGYRGSPDGGICAAAASPAHELLRHQHRQGRRGPGTASRCAAPAPSSCPNRRGPARGEPHGRYSRARKHLPFHDYDKPLSKPGRQLAADIDSAIQQVREQWIGYSRGLTGDTMGES